MNEAMKKYMIILGAFFGIILGAILILVLIFNSPSKDKSDRSFFDTFKSAHSDQDIIKYVRDKHGLNVRVVENHGPKNIKTNDGGYAVVSTDRHLTFDVFINSFGAISGDNHEYRLDKPKILSAIEGSGDLDVIKSQHIKDVSILTDNNRKNFKASIKLSNDLQMDDDLFLDELYTAHEILFKWQKKVKDDYGYSFKILKVSYEHRDGAPFSDELIISLDEKFQSTNELEMNIIDRNESLLSNYFRNKHHSVLDDIQAVLPEHYVIVRQDYYENLYCQSIKSLKSCDSYRIAVGLHADAPTEITDSFQYDDEETLKQLFKIVQQLQEVDLPIDTMHVKNIKAPGQVADDVSYRQMAEIRDLKSIQSKEDIKLHPLGR